MFSIVLIIALGLAGIVVWHVQGSRRPTSRLIVQIQFFIAMSLVLYLGGIAPHRPDAGSADSFGSLLFKSALILWWTHLAWTVIGLVHIYVRINHKPREAHLILDIAVALIYLGVALSVLGFVFEMPIATLVTTSGVVAVILGLALQNTLSDVFSGMALTLGKAFAIGDWVQLGDGTAGRVVETNWRSTYLLTGDNNIVVLPNSMLARQGLTSLSRPDETHQIRLAVRFRATQRPCLIEEVMRSVLQASTMIAKSPAPLVALKSIDALAITAELQFWVPSLAIGTPARNEIIDLVYDRCSTHGLSLAASAESLFVVDPGTSSHRSQCFGNGRP